MRIARVFSLRKTGTLTINLSIGVQSVSLSGTSATNNSPGALSLSTSALTFSGYTIGDDCDRPFSRLARDLAGCATCKQCFIGKGRIRQTIAERFQSRDKTLLPIESGAAGHEVRRTRRSSAAPSIKIRPAEERDRGHECLYWDLFWIRFPCCRYEISF